LTRARALTDRLIILLDVTTSQPLQVVVPPDLVALPPLGGYSYWDAGEGACLGAVAGALAMIGSRSIDPRSSRPTIRRTPLAVQIAITPETAARPADCHLASLEGLEGAGDSR
jgi:hypothetical protein